MNFLLIHGQLHKGSTYGISNLLLNHLKKENDSVNEIFLPLKNLTCCVGCFKCILTDESCCNSYEAMNEIYKLIEASDVIITTSPTYCMEMTAQLKMMFDHMGSRWLPHRPKGYMFQKICISISTAAGAGSKHVSKSISRQWFWQGVGTTISLGFNVNAMKFDEIDNKKMKKINKKINKVRLRKAITPLKLRMLFKLMRLNQKNNTWNQTDKNYWINEGFMQKKYPWKNKK